MTTLRPLKLEAQHIATLQLFQLHATQALFKQAFGRDYVRLWAVFEHDKNLLGLPLTANNLLDLTLYLNFPSG
jgi:hypothetical protein